MKPLATEFHKGGYAYWLKRVDDVALFEQTAGIVTAYEVVIVQRYEDREIHGTMVPAHEAMPGAERWGQAGWTLRSFTKATSLFAEVLAEQQQKSARAAMAEGAGL